MILALLVTRIKGQPIFLGEKTRTLQAGCTVLYLSFNGSVPPNNRAPLLNRISEYAALRRETGYLRPRPSEVGGLENREVQLRKKLAHPLHPLHSAFSSFALRAQVATLQDCIEIRVRIRLLVTIQNGNFNRKSSFLLLSFFLAMTDVAGRPARSRPAALWS